MGRRFATALMLMGMLLGVVGTAGSVAADSNYTCPDKSCAFTVPDSYSVASNDASQVIFKDTNSVGIFSVAASDGSGYNSLDDAVADVQKTAAASDGYQAGPSNGQNTVVGGNPATLLEYTSKDSSGTVLEYADFISLYHGKVYQLIFITTPDSEDAFVAGAKPVFDSWQFT